MKRIEVFDTTLRDGSQLEHISLSVEDKLRIAHQLDELGIEFIEGGWPGANPKDSEFFERAKTELELSNSTLVAFGSTRRAGGTVEGDPVLGALLGADTAAVCIVAKSWDYHVSEALRTTTQEALAMVDDSVKYLISKGRRVFVDAEHFFDGYKDNSEFATDVARTAIDAGAERVVLCDTNGGTMPSEVADIAGALVSEFGGDRIGIHAHNDGGCAVANSLAAIDAGVTHVQGCINGYGERTGNANLTTIIPNLELKMGLSCLPEGRLSRLSDVAYHIAEIVNVALDPQQPYVGRTAFAHKAGLHTSALARRPDAYEHVDPAKVGNSTRFVVSELAGRSTVALRASQLGITLEGEALESVVSILKELENNGYHFAVADGSLELLLRRAAGEDVSRFEIESYRVTTDGKGDDRTFAIEMGEAPAYKNLTEATVRILMGGSLKITTAQGNGPVNALDGALRSAIEVEYPALKHARLSDFRVRVLDTASATGAITRVLIDSSDAHGTWTTIGVSENIIEASAQALKDSIDIALLRVTSQGEDS